MSDVCVVCDGSGRLLHDVCPLCDGNRFLSADAQQHFVFVLAGQSNMVGRGTGDELDQTLINFIHAHADVYMAYDIDKNAKEQENSTSGNEFLRLCRETQWSDGGKCYTHGPEWGIAQRVIESLILQREDQQHSPHSAFARQGRPTQIDTKKPRIYFIKFAMGSTNLHEDWCPGGPYFEEFVSFTNTCLRRVAQIEGGITHQHVGAAATTTPIDCMFWNQGDADASGKAIMRDSYEANLVKFVTCVWKDLDCFQHPSRTRFPFVPLQLHWKTDENSKSTKTYRKKMEKVNEAIRNACQELGSSAQMAGISKEMEARLTSMCHEDGHSGSAALVVEGRHLADTFVEVLGS